jgi:hypothetical protein
MGFIENFFYYSDLEKTTPYTFILCAKTRIGCGDPSINRLLTMEKRGIRRFKMIFYVENFYRSACCAVSTNNN